MLCWQASGHIDIFINQRIECCLNNTINLRPLTSTHYAMLYPQNSDRIAAIDSVTSLHPIYTEKPNRYRDVLRYQYLTPNNRLDKHRLPKTDTD